METYHILSPYILRRPPIILWAASDEHNLGPHSPTDFRRQQPHMLSITELAGRARLESSLQMDIVSFISMYFR